MVAIPRLTVRTEFGSVMAVPHRGTLLFRNVPFGAPPFGPRRFQRAAPPVIWDGLRDGARSGVGMPQPVADSPLSRYFAPAEQGEDALTLEIQTPQLGKAGLPVVVWFHGGAFVSGAGSTPCSDGYAFARDHVVHVTVNSRLGIDGYALLEETLDSGLDNLGLRDQVAALEWIQRNIEHFGGDPGRVTIAGQGTGGASVTYLLACPAAEGLFVRAISQSGTPSLFLTVDEARDVARRIAHHADRPASIAALKDLDFDATNDVVAAVWSEFYRHPGNWGRLPRMPFPFAGIVGTEMLPQPAVSALARGASANVAILAGSTRDESSVSFQYLFPDVTLDSPTGRTILEALHADACTIDDAREANPGVSDLAIISAIATNTWVRMPICDMLEAHQGRSFLYEFTWESPAFESGTGSIQGIDIPFVRDDFENLLEQPIGARLLGANPSPDLAWAMHRAFVDFVVDGDPGWMAFSAVSRLKMRFDEQSEAVSDLALSPR